MSFKDYAKWFVDCINCNVCENYIYGKNDGGGKGFICNDNIDNRNYKPQHQIRPQAGYIDIDWFDKENHILLLGQNPRGGYEEHNKLYEIYDQIITAKILTTKQMESIQEIVDDYWVLTLLKEEIKKMFPDAAFAYANQILCRTKPEANKIKEKDGIKEVYETCFENRIFELIKKTDPTKIIAVGKRWEPYFNDLISKNNFPSDKFICACHPAYGRKKETLEQIKNCLEKRSS